MHGDSMHRPLPHLPAPLARMTSTTKGKGWMDTLPYLDDWDEVRTYDHLDLALGGNDDTGVS